jgi:hypothetical protein
VLDELHRNGIMAVVTIDEATNNAPRARDVVRTYRDHAAILFWLLGNEWNIPDRTGRYYFGRFATLAEAAAATQALAAEIRALDPNHPVASSYGDVDGNLPAFARDLTAVDIWGLNVYRGGSFGIVFEEWKAISGKPMFIGEFGTDAYNNVRGAPDEQTQADFNLALWHELIANLSAADPAQAALGGFVFEFQDELWKVPPHSSQQTGGFVSSGHPDNFSNEEYFGLLDIDRRPRLAYERFKTAFAPGYRLPARSLKLTAASAGASATDEFTRGWVNISINDASIYYRTGGAGGGRGITIAAIDRITGAVLLARSYDTYNNPALAATIRLDIEKLPPGTLLAIAAADEAGVNEPDLCAKRPAGEPLLSLLEGLGSREIRNYCFRDSWAMIAAVGESVARAEQLAKAVPASASVTVPFEGNVPPELVSLSPVAVSGVSAIFTIAASDANGGRDISTLRVGFSLLYGADSGCWIEAMPRANAVRLRSDDGLSYSAAAAGSPITLMNSRCSLDVANTSLLVAGNQVILTLRLFWRGPFDTKRKVWLAAVDSSGAESVLLDWGSWFPPGFATRINIWRLFHPGLRTHLYTSDYNEYIVLGGRGWQRECTSGQLLDKPETGATPLYRFYIPSTLEHVWTTDRYEYEVQSKRTPVFVGEGIDSFAFLSQAPGTLPVCRLFLQVDVARHHWTSDVNECAVLRGRGWTQEGIGWYQYPPATTCGEDGIPTGGTALALADSASLKTGPISAGQTLSVFGVRDARRVRVAGALAETVNHRDGEVQFVVPAAVTWSGEALVEVEDAAGTHEFRTQLTRSTVSAWVEPHFGTGQMQARNQDGRWNGPTHPAHAGEVVTLMINGAVPAGIESEVITGSQTAAPEEVKPCGRGTTCVRVLLPQQLGKTGMVEVRLRAGAVETQPGTYIYVE